MRPWKRVATLGTGQLVVLTALTMLILIGIAGLAVDIGVLWTARQRQQAATDAAAKAGAQEIASDNSGNVQTAAVFDATQNGFTQGSGGVTAVTINNPPLSGPYASVSNNTDYVEAIIQRNVPAYFLSVLGFKQFGITTRAVAKVNRVPDCIWVLDGSAHHSLIVGWDASSSYLATLSAPNCAIYVDSTNADPIGTHGGDNCINTDLLDVVSTTATSDSGCITPWPPSVNLPPINDPLANTPAPSFNNSCGTTATPTTVSSTTTLSPGVYCGGIMINGSAGTAFTVTFQQGLYVLYGGGLTVTGSTSTTTCTSTSTTSCPVTSTSTTSAGPSSTTTGTAGNCGDLNPPGMTNAVPSTTADVTLSGSGVTFYNTGTSSGTYAFEPVNINATAASTLSAPTSSSGGAIQGILFFSDRSVGVCSENIVYGGTYTGTMYFPSDLLAFGGAGSGYNFYIADELEFTQSTTVNANYSMLPNGSPIVTGAALAE